MMPDANATEVTCPRCSGKMFAVIPQARVFDFPEFSGVIVSHERVETCPHCAANYIALIDRQELAKIGTIPLIWRQVETNKSAVVPPSSAEIHAVNVTSMGRKDGD